MSESGGITASSLAITEKKPQRSGGCVGIFFQLFDWNRRFAKKKLFSKKLLPPVRLKQGSKKFGGDEKQPKHRLIADENSGGFPNLIKSNNKGCSVYSEKKHEMRSPGLVARLMGLDSMPAVAKDKPKKVSSNESATNKEEKFGTDTGRFEGEEQSFAKMGAKQELRPQKLQKTGLSERRPVTRFGAEALQIKSMLSRSRKHHPKLATPLKSPRNVSGRNASRLIGVATKILEPGMQNSRGKYALTCSDTLRRPSAVLQDPMALTPGNSEYSSYYTGASNALKGTSCKHCGHSLDILDSIPNQEEEPSVIPSPVSSYIEPCQDSERSMPRVPIFYSQEQRERAQQGSLHSAAVEAEFCSAGGRLEKNPINRGQMPQQLTSQESQPNHGSSHGPMHRTQKQNQMFPGRDRVPPRVRSSSLQSNRVTSAVNSINETKNFVALNKALNGITRMRMPTKSDSCTFETERRFCNRRAESLSPVRKRRSVNVTRQGESSEFTNFNSGKGLSGSSNSMSGKETVHPVRSMNRAYTERKLPYPQETGQNGSRQKGNDIVSFTFKSPVKQKTGVHGEAIGRRFQTNSCSDRTPGKLVSKENNGSICSEEPPFALRGDTLGVILEQKLKELTCQEVELAEGGSTSRKTTAVILQELISALTAERQFHEDDFVVRSNRKSDISHPDNMHHENTPTKFQATPKSATTPAAYNQDINHFSPGSVLEGSFSNNSYLSSSLDGNSISGDKLVADSMYFFCDESRSFNPDADLLDSATSLATGKCCKPSVSDLVNNITEVLQKINLFYGDFKGSKLDYAKDIFLNAELVLGNAAWNSSPLDKSFSITHFLLEVLETLASVMLMRFHDLLGFENAKHGSQLKQFIFDCVLEVLDSKVSRYSKSGFRAWTKLPPSMNTEILVFEILEEAKLWMAMTGLIHDEKIEWDMSHSLGKWTDFEIEVFENGAEIDRQILQNLVDEVVMDLCTVLYCKPGLK